MNSEHKFTIKRAYKFNKRIVRKDEDSYHALLIPVYDNIVLPMREALEKLMIENIIINESELFCSDFTYRASEDEGSTYIGDPGKKKEDIVN